MIKLFTFLLVCLFYPLYSVAQFTSLEKLTPLEARNFATREKHQSKVFVMDNSYWAVLANATGTHLWKLEGNSWKHALELVTRNSLADYVIDNNVVHVVLYSGVSTQFVSLEYDPAAKAFRKWSKNESVTAINLEEGVQLASLALSNSKRLWLASNSGDGNINVRWSDAPYNNWSAPITLERGVKANDLCAVITFPESGKIGVLWSNQSKRLLGFKTHTDGANPNHWSDDEVPASQSALQQGAGMADDHLSLKIAKDGTLYCAIKTGYNQTGFPLIALLVRRPNGTWDDLYEVSQTGTIPILLLNEEQNLLKVVYTSATYGGDIVYRESSTKNIAFCTTHTLIAGHYNYATSIKGNYNSDVIVLASSETQAVGVKATDDPIARKALPVVCPADFEMATDFIAYPNPFSDITTIKFILKNNEPYTLKVYDGRGAFVMEMKPGIAEAHVQNTVYLDASRLNSGLYMLRLQSATRDKSLKLIVDR